MKACPERATWDARRLALRGVCVLCLVLGGLSCLVRVRWIRQWSGPTGSSLNSVLVEGGTIEFERNAGALGATPAAVWTTSVNRQLEPAIRPRFRFGQTLGTTRVAAPVGLFLLGAPVAIWGWGATRRRLRRGTLERCGCGYPLAGVVGGRCPECGAVTPGAGPSKAVSRPR